MLCISYVALWWIGGGVVVAAFALPILAMFYFPRIW